MKKTLLIITIFLIIFLSGCAPVAPPLPPEENESMAVKIQYEIAKASHDYHPTHDLRDYRDKKIDEMISGCNAFDGNQLELIRKIGKKLSISFNVKDGQVIKKLTLTYLLGNFIKDSREKGKIQEAVEAALKNQKQVKQPVKLKPPVRVKRLTRQGKYGTVKKIKEDKPESSDELFGTEFRDTKFWIKK